MNSKPKDSLESNSLGLLLGLLSTLVAVLVAYFALEDLIITNKSLFRLLFLILSVITIISLYVSLSNLHILYKSIKNNYHKSIFLKHARLLYLKDIKETENWHILGKSQKHNLTDNELEKQILILLKNQYIEISGYCNPPHSYSETELYKITEKGIKLLVKQDLREKNK